MPEALPASGSSHHLLPLICRQHHQQQHSGHLRCLQTFRFSEEVDDDNSEEQYADADDDDDIADDRGNKDGDGRRRLLQKTVPESR